MNNHKIINLIPEDLLKEVPMFSLEGHETHGRVVSCYDGDSLKIVFGVQNFVCQWNCRLYGIDTPEIRTKNPKEKELGLKARDSLIDMVIGKVVNIKCHEFDKFGRVLVSISVDNVDVVTKLIEDGLGRFYDGGTKQPW